MVKKIMTISANKNDYISVLKPIIENVKNIEKSVIRPDAESLHILKTGIEKFSNSGMTESEVVHLYERLKTWNNIIEHINYAPDKFISKLLKNNQCLDLFRKNNLQTDINIINRLTKDEQRALLVNMQECLGKNNIPIEIDAGLGKISPFRSLYHEIGHVKDVLCESRPAPYSFNNDFNKYPKELKDWLKDENTAKIASSVSSYARTGGPAEFIAETFADLVSGKKLPDDVIALYKKLGGPMVSGLQ